MVELGVRELLPYGIPEGFGQFDFLFDSQCGRHSNPTAFCGSNVLFFGHPAGSDWRLGKSKKSSPEEM